MPKSVKRTSHAQWKKATDEEVRFARKWYGQDLFGVCRRDNSSRAGGMLGVGCG